MDGYPRHPHGCAPATHLKPAEMQIFMANDPNVRSTIYEPAASYKYVTRSPQNEQHFNSQPWCKFSWLMTRTSAAPSMNQPPVTNMLHVHPKKNKKSKRDKLWVDMTWHHGRETNQRPMSSVIHWDGKRRSASTRMSSSSSSFFFLFRWRWISLHLLLLLLLLPFLAAAPPPPFLPSSFASIIYRPKIVRGSILPDAISALLSLTLPPPTFQSNRNLIQSEGIWSNTITHIKENRKSYNWCESNLIWSTQLSSALKSNPDGTGLKCWPIVFTRVPHLHQSRPQPIWKIQLC